MTRKLNKEDRTRIAELFQDGFTIDELRIMYNVSIFRIMSCLNRFGVDV